MPDPRCPSCPHRPDNAGKFYLMWGETTQTGEQVERLDADYPEDHHCCHENLPTRTPCRGTRAFRHGVPVPDDFAEER